MKEIAMSKETKTEIEKVIKDNHHIYRSLAFTFAAIALYIPANLYPFMTMKFSGKYQDSTIWDGIKSLFEGGMWATATIVFMASIIIPVFKFAALLFINFAHLYNFGKVARRSLLILVEFIGRWSMLDIFLVSIMVAIIKFGSFAKVTADISSYLLGFVVIFTMLASATLFRHLKDLKDIEK